MNYASPTVQGASSTTIVRPLEEVTNFKINLALILIVKQNQLAGLPFKDPNQHINTFLELCDLVKIAGASNDIVRLRLFPFSLRDRAKAWLQSLSKDYITTCVMQA